MTPEPLRILLLEDDPNDAELIQATLTQAGLVHELRVATTRDEYLAALTESDFDIVLSDSGVPGLGRSMALDRVRESRPSVPFVAVSGAPAEDAGSPGPEAGFSEFVSKMELEALPSAIARAVEAGPPEPPAESAPGGEALEPSGDARDPTERLIDAVQRLSLARDLSTIMAIVRRAARTLTGADGATFVLREGDLCYYADEDAIAPLWKGKRFPMSACISGWVMTNARPAVIEDIYEDDRIPADAYRPTFVKSLAMVPIREESPVGAIGTYWATRHEAGPDEVALLQSLANSTAIAMENVQLYNELERRVRERTAKLEAANEELEAFSYSVSHDLRAPLRHIEGFAAALVEDCADDLNDEASEHVRSIRDATSRMEQIIEGLLNLSRISRTDLARETVDLTEIATEITAALREEDPGRDVEFVIEPGVSASGDPRLLRLVLENLLSNAWKYTSKEPRARIEFGRMEDDEARSVCYVRDDGAGFDMERAEQLFGPFQRLHSDADFPGVGIGLATVQRIVRRHGGRVWAEAAKGEGATFFFTLP